MVTTKRVKDKLEWFKILDLLSAEASNALGKELCLKLEPSTSITHVQKWQQETTEAVGLLYRGCNISLANVSDVRPLISRSQRGGQLSIQELYAIGLTLENAYRARNVLLSEGKTTYFVNMGSSLPVCTPLQTSIKKTIIGPDEIADDATQTLQKLRRDIVRIENKMRDQLDHMVRSSTIQKYLQEPLITIRNSRYVVPVKLEYRQFVPGIVHDQSASGATLFVEPMTVFDLGNNLREVIAQEKHEIDRILSDLSSQVAENADKIQTLLLQLAHLDFILAKGALALDFKASLPKINEQGQMNLREARHPLLENAVPITTWIGNSFNTLIITGPNTGGKTVLLKTIGLLVLMHQAGLHIPAKEDSELPIYDNVACDIGDEQSIEQSLSTFSGHMNNIISILDDCTPKSLVLLDELGAGTDPSEGAALGMAILEHLGEKGASTIATTHYSELKVFAYTRPGVENASVEFDPVTLKPTYKLVIGLPGRSNAFSIASRLGLAETIVNRARTFMSTADAQADELIRSLQEKRQHLEQLILETQMDRDKAATISIEWEMRQQKLMEKEQFVIRRAKEEAINAVNYAHREAERIIKELRSQTSILLEKDRTIAAEITRESLSRTRQKIHKQLNLNDSEMDTFLTEGLLANDSINTGDNVYIPHLKAEGSVINPPDTDGNVRVQIGILKMTLPLTQLVLVENESSKRLPGSVTTSLASTKAQSISMEIDLRGLTADDAEYELSKYLDDAKLASLGRIRIIHGKGTGVLRQMVRDYLKRHKDVESFSLGDFREGGTGVTVVTLKK